MLRRTIASIEYWEKYNVKEKTKIISLIKLHDVMEIFLQFVKLKIFSALSNFQEPLKLQKLNGRLTLDRAFTYLIDYF